MFIPAMNAAASTGVASFSRWDYASATTGASDASKFSFMDLGYGSSSQTQATIKTLISSIHSSDPGVKILLYKTIYINPTDTQGIGSCFPWNTSQPLGGIPKSYFLLDANGNPLYNTTYKTYWLDPGNPAVQQACANSAITLAHSGGFDGIFWDMMSTSLFWAGLKPSNCTTPSCMSNANWHSAMESYIQNVTGQLHAAGLLAIGNISGGAITYCCGGGPAYWDAFQQLGLDGAMEESFTSGTNGLPVGITQWKQGLANEAWNEANGKYLVGNGDVTTNQGLNTYGLATMLLAAAGRSSWAVDSGNPTNGEYWFPSYTTAQGLGAPTGAYSILSDGLYVRHFANGTVVVNPTTTSITDPMYGTVSAQSGMIL
jgi:hypothetical protein